MRPFFALLLRDWRLSLRSGGGALPSAGFFLVAATMVPLGVGPDLPLLSRMAGGVLWVLAVLATLLSLDRLFQADAEDGSLELLALSPLPLEAVSAAKMAAHWLGTGLPLTLLSLPMAAMFDLPAADMANLFVSLLVGTPAVSALGAVGAGVTLSIRRGGMLIPLIVLPILSPVVIFGAGAAAAAGGAIWFLSAFSVLAVGLSPFAAAAALRHYLAQ